MVFSLSPSLSFSFLFILLQPIKIQKPLKLICHVFIFHILIIWTLVRFSPFSLQVILTKWQNPPKYDEFAFPAKHKSQLMLAEKKICYFDLNRKLHTNLFTVFSPSTVFKAQGPNICVNECKTKTCWRLNEVLEICCCAQCCLTEFIGVARAILAQRCEYLLIFSGHREPEQDKTKNSTKKNSLCEWERMFGCITIFNSNV